MVWLQGINWIKKSGRMNNLIRLAKSLVFETIIVANDKQLRRRCSDRRLFWQQLHRKTGFSLGLSSLSLTLKPLLLFYS